MACLSKCTQSILPTMQITEELIREIVSEVVDRIEKMRCSTQEPSRSSAPTEKFHRKVLTGSDVEYYFKEGVEVIVIARGTIVTPLAKERSGDLKLELVFE